MSDQAIVTEDYKMALLCFLERELKHGLENDGYERQATQMAVVEGGYAGF